MSLISRRWYQGFGVPLQITAVRFQVFSSGIPFSGPRVCVHLSGCCRVSSGRSPLGFRVQFSRSRSQASGASASCPRSRAGSGRSPGSSSLPHTALRGPPSQGAGALCYPMVPWRREPLKSGCGSRTEQLGLCTGALGPFGGPSRCRRVPGSSQVGLGAQKMMFAGEKTVPRHAK